MDQDLEPIYDQQIAPLMTQIITIATEHNMPFAATFQLNDGDEEGPLFCSSAHVPEGAAKTICQVYDILTSRPVAFFATLEPL